MNFEHKIRTPQKKYYVFFFCCISGLALISFLIFGHLLREYIKFAVDKQKAQDDILVTKKNHEELKEYLQTQEDDFKTRLSELKQIRAQQDSELAERDAKIKSHQKAIDEINVLNTQLESARNDYAKLQNDLKSTLKDLEVANGSYTALFAINEDFKKKNEAILKEQEAQKSAYLNDIERLNQIKDGKDKDITKLDTKITAIETQIDKMNSKYLMLKQDVEQSQVQLSDEQLKLSSMKTELASMANRVQLEASKLTKIVSDHNDLQLTLTKAITEKALLSGEIAFLQKKKVELQSDYDEVTSKISALSQKKASLEGDIVGLQERVEAALLTLNKLESQIKQEEGKQKDTTEDQLIPAPEKDVNNVQ